MGKNKTCLIEKAKYLLSITTTVEIIIGTLFSDIIAKPCYILIYHVFFTYIRNLFFALSFFSFLLNPVLPTSQDSISLTDHLWAIYNPKVASANPCPWFFYHPMFIVLCSMHRNISVWICNEGWGTFSTIRSLEGAISRWKYDNIFYSLSGHHGKLLCSLNTVTAKLV